MNETTLRVEDNMIVNLAYSVTTASGQTGSHKAKQNVKQVVQGRRQLVPGLEQALYGMVVGEEKDVVVEANNGYGEVDPGAIKTLSRNRIAALAAVTPGQRMRLLHRSSGEIRRATVVDVQADKIVLDFNHPLAGKTLHYHVRVDDLRPATSEELESGKVDQPGSLPKPADDANSQADLSS